MFPLFRSARLICLLAFAAALIPLGCDSGPELKAFQDQVSKLDRVDEDLGKAQHTIARIEDELKKISRELITLRQTAAAGPAGASPDSIKALEQRLNDLESQVQKPAAPAAAAVRPAPGPAAAENAAAAPAAAGRKGGKKGPAVVAKATATPRVPAAKKAAGETAKPKAPPKAPAVPAIPAGSYYQVSPTDTLTAIAARHKITPAALLAANNLPGSARLMAGQQIFIPGKR